MSFGLSNVRAGITLLNVSSALGISIYSLIQRVVIIEGDPLSCFIQFRGDHGYLCLLPPKLQ